MLARKEVVLGHSRSLFVLAFVTVVVTACEGSADLGRNEKSPPVAPEAGIEPAPLPPGPPPTPPDASLAELQARCADPAHGPVDRYADLIAFQKKLVGRWFSCELRQPLVVDAPGIEFHFDGTWNLLRDDGGGTFIAQRGLDHEGKWSEKYTGFTGYFQIDVEGAQMQLLTFDFEQSPRRMRMKSDQPSTDPLEGKGWYVTMAASDTTQLP